MPTRLLERFEEGLVTVGFAVSSVLAFVNVVLRYGFSETTAWSEDGVIVLVVWSVFVGSAIAVRRAYHIRVEVVVDLLPERWQLVTRVLTDLVCLGFALFILVYGILFDVFLYEAGAIPLATLNIPEYLLFLCIPLGGLLMALRYAEGLWRRLSGRMPLGAE